MANENTKIELLTEAIETLVLASVAAALHAPRAHLDIGEYAQNIMLMQNVHDARECLAESLRVFLRPTLRIVNPEPVVAVLTEADDIAEMLG